MSRDHRKYDLSFRIGVTLLFLLLGLALFAPFISNNVPFYIRVDGHSYYPLLRKIGGENQMELVVDDQEVIRSLVHDDWRFIPNDAAFWPPVAYNADVPDPYNRKRVSPFGEQLDDRGRPLKRYRHFLGTDQVGRDVLAGLIWGSRISLGIAILSMLLAGLIGLSLGGLAGFLGDHSLRINLGNRLGMVLAFILIIYYGIVLPQYMVDPVSPLWIIFISLIVFFGATFLLGLLPGLFRKGRPLRIDHWVSRAIEWFTSLPKLILILAVAAVMEGSFLLVLLIIGLTGWTFIARIARAEMLKTREEDYIQSAKALGMRRSRIFLRHAIPNILNPVIVSLSFGAASAVVIESSLSFLGIGVPADAVSWGAMIAQGRTYFESWWLVIFPGLMIFLTVMAFQLIGEGMNKGGRSSLSQEM
jgi:peptide/nickel transport system permease protein